MEIQKDIQGFGRVIITKKRVCKNIVMRWKSGNLVVSAPLQSTMKDVEKVVLANKEKLLLLKKKMESIEKQNTDRVYNADNVYSHFHSLVIVRHREECIKYRVEKDKVTIFIPEQAEIESDWVQEAISSIFELVLKSEAEQYFPTRFAELAKAHGFTFRNVKVTKAKHKWGSCSNTKQIIMSACTMTLPMHLIDYVILHELCHTVHMNHSADFYALLDTCCGGNNKKYYADMKKYRLNILPKFERCK